MTEQYIEKIYDVLKTADGGCSTCVKNIIGTFVTVFPESKNKIIELIKDDEDLNWEDFEDDL
jgi:hypothetical protein